MAVIVPGVFPPHLTVIRCGRTLREGRVAMALVTVRAAAERNKQFEPQASLDPQAHKDAEASAGVRPKESQARPTPDTERQKAGQPADGSVGTSNRVPSGAAVEKENVVENDVLDALIESLMNSNEPGALPPRDASEQRRGL